VDAGAEAKIGDGFDASAGLDLGTEVGLDAELGVGPGLDVGAEGEWNVEFRVGTEGCVEALRARLPRRRLVGLCLIKAGLISIVSTSFSTSYRRCASS
jgi:hypothetical protein